MWELLLSLIKNETIEEMKPNQVKNLKEKKKKNHGFIASSGFTLNFSFDHISHPDDLTSHLTYCFGEVVWNIQDYFSEILDIGS